MRQQQEYTLFTNRSIFSLVVPLFFEQLLFLLVGTADTFMVASLGAASISAVSLADMFNGLAAGILFALATGGAVVVSQCIGAKALSQARESAKQLLVLTLIIGLAVALFCEMFLSGIVRLLYGKLEPAVYDATMVYFRITLAGMPFIAVYGGCAALFRSMNRTRITMYVSVVSNLVNVAGNALLIFGCSLGVAGAAYATVFSRFVSMAICLWMLTNPVRPVFINWRSGFRFSRMLVRKILRIGIPGGIENGVFQFGRVVVLGLIASYGTHEIAANAMANLIDYFGCIPGYAFSLAVVTVIGQAVGAGDREQVRHYVGKMMKWCYSAHILWNILLFVCTPFLLSCFSRIDPDTRRLAWILILIHNGIGLFCWPMSFVFPNVLRAMNDVRVPMFISLGSMLIVRVGLSYAFAPWVGSGVMAVWIAMIGDWCVRIAGFRLRYRSGAWCRLAGLSGAGRPVNARNG